jgi:iron complex transport system substrate-binding protein
MRRPTSSTSRRAAAVATLALGALALAGCSAGADDGAAADDASKASTAGGAFPVTIESALGDAVIPEQPERVVTWGWSTQDAVLALGVVPVAMPRNDYGGGEAGILPWDEDAIEELGGETPTLLSGSDTGEVPFEEVAAAQPDVILAPYSGITQEEFDRLSEVAPVVAYPDQPWALPWQDQLEIVGTALGKSDEAAALQAETDEYVSSLVDEHPELDGTTFVYAAANTPGTLNIFRADDPRVDLLEDMGMTLSPSVAELDASPDDGTYFYGLSEERLGEIDTDVLVMYFGSQEEVDAFTALPSVGAMESVQEGRFAPIVGESFVMASSAPTVLSIPWMLDQYVPQLAEAAAASK